MSGVTTTPTLGLELPPVGGARDQWGGYINNNSNTLDTFAGNTNSQLAALAARITALENPIHPPSANTDDVGTVRWWPSASHFPNTYIPCDGSQYASNDYPDLFTVLGNTWGGDGTSTYNVPDLRGRVLVGQDQGAGHLEGQIWPDTVGTAGGNAAIWLTASQMPAHQHGGSTDTAPDHTHQVGYVLVAQEGFDVAAVYNAAGAPGEVTSSPAGSHSHGITTDTQGASQGHSNVQPGALGVWLIKAWRA